MKLLQSAVCLSSIALLLSACSDSSSSSGRSSTDPNPIDKIEVGACESIDNKVLSVQVIEATDSLVQFAFGLVNAPEDLEALQNRTEKAKEIFKTALESYPNSCDAQLGLAAAQMVNVIGNEDVSAIYRKFASGDDAQVFSLFNIRNNFAGTALKAAVKTQDDDKLITDRVQEIIANAALPSIDSAIYLLNNIRKTEDYTFSYETDNLEIYLGQGEFALSVGTLNALKAFLTVIASYELDASLDNSYDWLTSSLNWSEFLSEEDAVLTDEDKAALEHAISLFEKNSTFLSVKSSWKSAYKSIPDVLDSAIENMKDSYAYLLEQAKSGKTTSLSPFVGDGEESDLYADEIEQTLDILDSVQSALRGTVTVSIDGEDVQIDVRKFFELTDGFQQYLPYHTVNPIDTWKDAQTNPDPKYISWISADEYDADNHTVYAEKALSEKARETLNSSIILGEFGEDLNEMYFTTNDESFWYASVEWDGCKYSIQEGYDIDAERTWFSLDSSVCKTENGIAKFKAIDANITPNPFNFTDKNGNVTLSFTDFSQELFALKQRGAEMEEYVSLLERTVIFPDPTFQGVFPNMDQHKISVLLSDLR